MSENNRFAEFQKKLAKKQDLKGRKKGKDWGGFGDSRYHLTTSSSDVIREIEEKRKKKPENRFAAFQEKLKNKIDLDDRKNKKDWAGFNDSRYHLTQTLSDDELEDPKLEYVEGCKDALTHESDNIPISEGTEDDVAYEWTVVDRRRKLSTGQGLYKPRTSASGAQYGLAEEPRKRTNQGGKFGAFQAKLKERNDLKIKKGGWAGFSEGRYDLSSTSSTFEQLSSPRLPQAPPTPEVDVKKFRNFQTQLKEKLVLEDEPRAVLAKRTQRKEAHILPIPAKRKDYINVCDPWGIKTFLYDDQTTVAHLKAHYFHTYSKAVDVRVTPSTVVPDYVHIKDIIFPDLKKLYVKKAKAPDKYFRFR